MDKQLKAQLIKSSAQMDIEQFLEDKSSEFKDGFYSAMQYSADLTKALLDVYFEIKNDEI